MTDHKASYSDDKQFKQLQTDIFNTRTHALSSLVLSSLVSKLTFSNHACIWPNSQADPINPCMKITCLYELIQWNSETLNTNSNSPTAEAFIIAHAIRRLRQHEEFCHHQRKMKLLFLSYIADVSFQHAETTTVRKKSTPNLNEMLLDMLNFWKLCHCQLVQKNILQVAKFSHTLLFKMLSSFFLQQKMEIDLSMHETFRFLLFFFSFHLGKIRTTWRQIIGWASLSSGPRSASCVFSVVVPFNLRCESY